MPNDQGRERRHRRNPTRKSRPLCHGLTVSYRAQASKVAKKSAGPRKRLVLSSPVIQGEPSSLEDVLPTSVIELETRAVAIRSSCEPVGLSGGSRMRYSSFHEKISALGFNYFLRGASLVVDPFAGWGHRHAAALKSKTPYHGFDCSPVAIEFAKREFGVQNILADSRNAELPPGFDAVFTCPPYWNIEPYDGSANLSTCDTYEQFLIEISQIFARIHAAASPGSTFCIVVGNFRAGGVFYDFVFDFKAMMLKLGSKLFDEVILNSRKLYNVSLCIKQCRAQGYTVKVHEHFLVFKKKQNASKEASSDFRLCKRSKRRHL